MTTREAIRNVAMLVLLLLLRPGVVTWAEDVITVDGVPHVHNGPEPSQGRQTVQLEELWRIGGPEDEAIFGLITQVLNDEDGNIYILDSQLCEVRVYTPDGTYLKSLIREGEGPGEVTRVRNLALLADGTVGVIQEVPAKMVRVDRNNNPAANVEIHKPGQRGYMMVDGCFAGGPTLVFSGTHAEQAVEGVQMRTNFLGIFSLDGVELARLVEDRVRRDYNDFVLSERQVLPAFYWANSVGPDGRVYTAPDRDRYAIQVYSPTGQLERVITREYEHYRRSQAEWQRLYDAFDGVMRGADIEYRIEIEPNEYDILTLQHGVRVREDNSLWILPSRGIHDQPPGVMLTFDVFDPAGHFTRQVSFACDADGIWDGFFFVGPDRAIVVTGHVEAIFAQYGGGANTYEDEEGGASMEVICYHIPG